MTAAALNVAAGALLLLGSWLIFRALRELDGDGPNQMSGEWLRTRSWDRRHDPRGGA